MPSPTPKNLPPGFDKMSRDEQVEYVQELWNHIVADESNLTVPSWHLKLLRERTETEASQEGLSWDEVKSRALGRSSR